MRRLHLAGASLREIAHALDVSHQRVQQIVEGAGGTWWQKVWRNRNVRRDAVCTFCERPPSEVSKLIAGPNVYICDACVAVAEHAFAGQVSAPAGVKFQVARHGFKGRCAFCAKARSADRAVVSAAPANVCAGCLALCRQILDDRTSG